MEKLKNALNAFETNVKNVSNEIDLQSLFHELAPVFLYGGYIQVRNEYKVYIRTVEFYFHSEKADGIHDPIVYHRNGRGLDVVPYFPPMTLHAHNSGFDIAFESRYREYRASALIRAYEVINNKGEYLLWNSKRSKFEISSKYCFNKQSTYLYTLLNGFVLEQNNNITWIDEPRKMSTFPAEKTRQNVFQSEKENEYIKKKERCTRKWSFTREEDLM